MRPLAIGIVASLLVPVSAAAWEPDVDAAARYAAAREGEVGFAVRAQSGDAGHSLDGRSGFRATSCPRCKRLHESRSLRRADVASAPSWSWNADRRVPAASVLKVMLMVAYLRQPAVTERPLASDDRELLAPMIRRSDDVTATRIRDMVGNGALARLARRARMRCFRPAAVWGLSRTCAADQARFVLQLERLLPPRHRRAALRLLGSIVPSQRWGIARVRPPGWALYFKGGWGSGTGAVDHQVALLRRGRRRVAVAITTTSSPSHAYGKETLRGVAFRLLNGLRRDSNPAERVGERHG